MIKIISTILASTILYCSSLGQTNEEKQEIIQDFINNQVVNKNFEDVPLLILENKDVSSELYLNYANEKVQILPLAALFDSGKQYIEIKMIDYKSNRTKIELIVYKSNIAFEIIDGFNYKLRKIDNKWIIVE